MLTQDIDDALSDALDEYADELTSADSLEGMATATFNPPTLSAGDILDDWLNNPTTRGYIVSWKNYRASWIRTYGGLGGYRQFIDDIGINKYGDIGFDEAFGSSFSSLRNQYSQRYYGMP